LVRVLQGLEVDKGPVLKTEILKLGIPVSHPIGRDKLLKGWDDVTVELWDAWGAGPANGIRNAGFFGTGNGSKSTFAKSTACDDRQAVIDALSGVPTLGTDKRGRRDSELNLADLAQTTTPSIEEVRLLFLVIERFGRERFPLRNGTLPKVANLLSP
jgi:hypothetical protein